jgi:Mn2+/Fe2+ NRAMP family transporter
VAHVPWGTVAYDTLVPHFSISADYVVTVVAVLGTTITPYCFFWQSSQEAQDMRVDPAAHALLRAPREARAEISRMRFDTYFGMGYSNVISLFIIVATAATLNAAGVTDIQTSSQAAEALRPIAGVFTFALFAAGIIGIGLLAVPVLAGSGAYALGEALDWTIGLDRLPGDARAFYATIAASTFAGIAINFIGLDPIKALFWSAVINGVVAVPLMVIIMLLGMRADVMGRFVLPRPLWAMGWLCTLAMAVAVGSMFATW